MVTPRFTVRSHEWFWNEGREWFVLETLALWHQHLCFASTVPHFHHHLPACVTALAGLGRP